MILIALAAAALSPTVAAMRWERRILIVSAPLPVDPMLATQRRLLGNWREGADARDLTVVEIVGDTVAGAGDTAIVLRRRYRLPPARFAVVLIGKDGGEKRRASAPLTADALAQTIDAMPMRRVGGR